MATVRDEWLGQVVEEALDPDIPICDPHHHLWERPGGNNYLLGELLADIGGGHRIAETVFVECSAGYRESGPEEMRPLGETEFVHGVAMEAARGGSRTNVAAGIVGTVDLLLGDGAGAVLEAHMQASDRFRGIRHRAPWDASPEVGIGQKAPKELLRDGTFRRGFDHLRRLGLTFDAWLYHPQLSDVVDLARAFPDVPIILNHVGGLLRMGPYRANQNEAVDNWKRGIAAVAGCPNATIKLGGLGMATAALGLQEGPKPPSSGTVSEVLGPYILYCIEQFGPDRCMFESNFPVDKVSYSYTVMWNAFKRIAEGFSPSERACLFRDTAARVYRTAD